MVARILLFASVGVLVPIVGGAQESSTPADVLTLMRSNTPIGVAWGAFEAATFQITEAVPAMIAALEAPPPGSQHERDYVAAALLDALIQIRPVPGVPSGPQATAAVVAPYLDRWPIQTLILLGRSGPEGDSIVVNLFRSLPRKRNVSFASPNQMWFALANLLARRSPSGFAATLLEDIKVELVVTVSDAVMMGSPLSSGRASPGQTASHRSHRDFHHTPCIAGIPREPEVQFCQQGSERSTTRVT